METMNEKGHSKTAVQEALNLAPTQVQIACRTKEHIKIVTDAMVIEMAQQLEIGRWYLIPVCPDCESEKHCLIRFTQAGFSGLVDELETSVFGPHVH